jgi:DNA primase
MSEGNGSRPEGWVDFSRAKKVPFEAVVAALELSGKLRRYGDEYKGVCPLHGGEKESFGFNVEKGLFHCFGCKRSGNLLDFVNHKLFEGRQIKEAAKWLISLVDGSVDNDIPVPEVREVQAVEVDEGMPPESSMMTARDAAMCRGIARYLSSLFSTLGNVETIERELTRCVAEEVSAVLRDA